MSSPLTSSSRRRFLQTLPWIAGAAAAQVRRSRPNIIFILADDIGYGDLSCYGAERVKTPNVDRVAQEGVRFTDAHSSASVCTPTRYAALTGQYAFRNAAADHILDGDAPMTVPSTITTLPMLLRRCGYSTGLVGKWHMGVGTPNLDWNGEIKPGPLEAGFNYAFYYPATNDRVPCVYIENRRVVGLDPRDPLSINYRQKIGSEPTGREHPEMLKLKLLQGHDATIVNGISRIGYMSGGKSAWWVDEQMADTLTAKAVSFIEQPRSAPFYLYFATVNIHQPRWPNARFRGTTGCGTRCDAIAEFDASVSAVLAALERRDLADNTLLVISSDNGPAMDDGYLSYDVRDANGHRPSGILRGGKGSVYEGGHRMPFIARWPRHIRPASESDELLSLVDLPATFGAAAGGTLNPGEGPDSFNMLPALLGQRSRTPLRDHAVFQGATSATIAVREGDWKLIPAVKPDQSPQLFNLKTDLTETSNVARDHPEIVQRLTRLLTKVKKDGHSRPM